MPERRPHPSAPSRTTTRPAAGSHGGAHQPRADGRTERPLRQPRSGARPPARGSSGRGSSATGSARSSSARSGAAQLRSRWGHQLATLRLPLAPSGRRLHAVLLVVAVGLSLCAGRLLQLQGFDSSAYAATSTDQFTRTLPLLPSRGEITDRNGAVLASTQPAVAVTADPTLTLKNAVEIAGILSPYLQMSSADLLPLLTKPNTHFVYLKKQVPALTYSRLSSDLSNRGIYGVFRESDPIRTYPAGSTAASVVGFVNGAGTGVAGIESELNSSLAGVEGKETYESAPNGNKIPLGGSSLTPAQNGVDVQLTIDSELQYTAERRLAAAVEKTDADSGFAITLDVKTGEVLAMANVPTFDPGNLTAKDQDDRGNRAAAATYEPGSVEKVLTSAALLDSGAVTMKTHVKIPNRLSSGGAMIKDHYEHEELHYNLRGVVAKSLNIGTALLTRQISKQQLHDYLVSFGLGRPTGIEVPGEASGIIPSATMDDAQRDRVAFGQALSVTGVQEAAAIAGIINGGIYNPPTLVKSQTTASGTELANPQRNPRRIVSAATSASVRDLMAAVVDNQQNLAMDAYDTGGKTGTAQLANSKCHCYPKGSYVTSYVNFAPLNDPKLMTYVVLTHPRKGDTGSGTAGPVVLDVMNQALPRYSVAPDKTIRKPLPISW
ncbi:peptidoglycan D,D-transpeptidase FtsI family protein [uncultured Friedmanniella sp.]|uniref:peptidoglycan D,D-transpeptidase FtsI family protein n=1 Tax=uncultured Friedmanniella sp. TaxID=335381 RepID=UPI0035C9F30C